MASDGPEDREEDESPSGQPPDPSRVIDRTGEIIDRALAFRIEGFLRALAHEDSAATVNRLLAADEHAGWADVPEGIAEAGLREHSEDVLAGAGRRKVTADREEAEASTEDTSPGNDRAPFEGPPPAPLAELPVSRSDPSWIDAWVHCEAGSFLMGASRESDGRNHDPAARPNEAPVRELAMAEFYMARYPVTCAQYAAFLAAKPERQPPRRWDHRRPPSGRENHPVVSVSAIDAEAFCRWLDERARATGATDAFGAFGLPTEAEWEYAARGIGSSQGDGTYTYWRYPWGSSAPTGRRATFLSEDRVGSGTTEVNAHRAGATPQGTFDLAGNVWEWCADWLGAYGSEPGSNPKGSSDDRRAVRGGSFSGGAPHLRCAYRFRLDPRRRFAFIGFRVVWRSGGHPGFGA
jgi:formylglycine-generating enzyme required for sulfatase activity